MPRAYPGTFEGRPRYRWTTMVNGQRLRVTCNQLNLPREQWTKDGSYQAADEYFRRLQANPVNEAMERLSLPAEQLQRLAEQGIAAKAILDAKGDVSSLMDVDGLVEGVITDTWDDQHKLQIIQQFGEKIGVSAVRDYRLEVHAARFLELELAKGSKPRTYGELSESITAIINTPHVLHPGMDVRDITKTTVEDYYLYLRRTGRENAQQKKQFGFFKRLVKYFWSADLIELPRNLDYAWDFRVTTKAVKEYDLEEVKALLRKLTGRLRLYALLGLNCGMLSVDVARTKSTCRTVGSSVREPRRRVRRTCRSWITPCGPTRSPC